MELRGALEVALPSDPEATPDPRMARCRVRYLSGWLPPDSADRLLAELQSAVAWSQHRVRLFGREYPSPRLSAWIGDADARYRYSGVAYEPAPWTPHLRELRATLETELRASFNSVLVNRYRDGNDAMGWHADDEPELGPEPLIASVSLGATRRFCLKPRVGAGATVGLELTHGSLLVMGGPTQSCFKHALPRTRKPVGERINLTFRQIG